MKDVDDALRAEVLAQIEEIEQLRRANSPLSFEQLKEITRMLARLRRVLNTTGSTAKK